MVALYLALIHTLFLAAVSLRLTNVGYSGKRIVRLCAISLSLWPVLWFVGLATKSTVLLNYGGLTAIITITFIYYLAMEIGVLLENLAERNQRHDEIRKEEDDHQVKVEENEKELAEMFPIKSYFGDANTLNTISDLGKLKDAGIPCRIEGGIVKMLYVRKTDIARVERVIAIDSLEMEEGAEFEGATAALGAGRVDDG